MPDFTLRYIGVKSSFAHVKLGIPAPSKKEQAWFDRAKRANAHKQQTGVWGPYASWVKSTRDSWDKVLLNDAQIAFLRKIKFPFAAESKKGVSGAKLKGGDLATLVALHVRLKKLNAEELAKHDALLEVQRKRYEDGYLAESTAVKLGIA